MTDLPIVTISPRAAASVKRGYLWVYSNEIDMHDVPAGPGTWCWFRCGATIVATGYCNRHSLIAGRVIAQEKCGDITSLVTTRLAHAFARRQSVMGRGAVRLLYSEADLLPGVIIDWYGGVAVVQSNTAGIDTVMSVLETAIPTVFEGTFMTKLDALVIRADTAVRRFEGVDDFARIAFGDRERVVNGAFSESGVRYAADFLNGQKTGFFIDQSENRAFVAALAASTKPANVLDLFCYSGGWGLRALAAGAQRVTFVDQSKDALALVGKGMALNGFAADRAITVREDAFDFLGKNNGAYDLVVADPPAFVKSQKSLPQAAKAYEKLNRLAWRRVAPGGVLITCSCSYHLDESGFTELLSAAVAKEQGLAHVIFRGGSTLDHPALLSMPETSYLKCRGLRKLSRD